MVTPQGRSSGKEKKFLTKLYSLPRDAPWIGTQGSPIGGGIAGRGAACRHSGKVLSSWEGARGRPKGKCASGSFRKRDHIVIRGGQNPNRWKSRSRPREALRRRPHLCRRRKKTKPTQNLTRGKVVVRGGREGYYRVLRGV